MKVQRSSLMERELGSAETMDLNRQGAALASGVLDRPRLEAVRSALGDNEPGRPGRRLRDVESIQALLEATGAIGALAADAIGPGAKPVRAVLFDKTPSTNWSLGWHQDRTIVVKRRIDVEGFGPWSRKDGLQHVAPPFAVLEKMVTLRVHLDDVGPDNAPLLIALGSHRLGRIAVDDIDATVAGCETYACLASAGDVWIYSTPILHASNVAAHPTRRRVLQVDYAAFDLPTGLHWLGV